MNESRIYTSNLGAGLGLVEETLALLELWEPGLGAGQLHAKALDSGKFPAISARRLTNIIKECFAPRFLVNGQVPALTMKALMMYIPVGELLQLMFLFTARANPILYDFVREVYWPAYASGKDVLSNQDALLFVDNAISEARTTAPWSEKVRKNVAGYLTGCCADYGLLEKGRKQVRRFKRFVISPILSAFLAYDLHFDGLGDNAVISHSDWELFGLQPKDVRDELKRLSFKGFLIVQFAGDVSRIDWKYKTREELLHVISQG
jgi:hypothetical protein